MAAIMGYPFSKYEDFPVIIIDQSRNTFQHKYCAEYPPTFWANQCPFYNYRSMT